MPKRKTPINNDDFIHKVVWGKVSEKHFSLKHIIRTVYSGLFY